MDLKNKLCYNIIGYIYYVSMGLFNTFLIKNKYKEVRQ